MKLGQLCQDVEGRTWVYVGYRVTSIGTQDHHFIKCLTGAKVLSTPLHQYNASNIKTILKKFPSLQE